MRKSAQPASWAVFEIVISGKPGPRVVCDQAEWEQLEKDEPGSHVLIKGGITNEGEAERLARGSSGEDAPPKSRKKSILQLPGAMEQCASEPEGLAESA